MQGALDTRAKLASPARKEDEERDEKSSQKLIGRLDRSHQQLFQQHRPKADIDRIEIPQRSSLLRQLAFPPSYHRRARMSSKPRLLSSQMRRS